MGDFESWQSFLTGGASGVTVMGLWLWREINRADAEKKKAEAQIAEAEARADALHAEKFALLSEIKKLNGNGHHQSDADIG